MLRVALSPALAPARSRLGKALSGLILSALLLTSGETWFAVSGVAEAANQKTATKTTVPVSKPIKTDADRRAEIEAENAARKTAKARGRIAKLKAKQAGETRKMPLSGRDALKAIREG